MRSVSCNWVSAYTEVVELGATNAEESARSIMWFRRRGAIVCVRRPAAARGGGLQKIFEV